MAWRAPRWPTLFLCALFLCACGSGRDHEPEVVATLGDEPVLYEELEEFLATTVGEDWQGLESAVLSALFEQYLDERLLGRLARGRGLVTDSQSGRAALEELLLDAATEPSSNGARVREFYDQHPDRFRLPERVELHQILVEERATAEEAATQLAAGEPFEEVARRLSIDPSAPYGGYQGELAREDLPLALAESIFALEEGEVSEVVEADYGFHIFLVQRKLAEEIVPLEQAALEIQHELEVAQADSVLADLLAEARERYDVVIEEGRLPWR